MTTESPLISIIVVAYRMPEYLNQALESVSKQTCSDYEIIVVDDCSGDEFTSRYELPNQARLICREKRFGAAAAPRNTGLREARGKYIALLDQDDIWLPDKLAVQVEALEKKPEAGLAFCYALMVDESLRPLPQQTKHRRVVNDALQQMLTGCFIKTPSAVLIRREVIDKCGLFDESIIGASDWDLWLRIARNYEFVAIPEPLVLYRMHSGQLHRRRAMMHTAMLKIMDKNLEWARTERPQVLSVVRRRYARMLRGMAKESLRDRDTRVAMEHLRNAVTMWPWSVRIYPLMAKAAFDLLRGQEKKGEDDTMTTVAAQVRLFKPKIREEAIEAVSEVLRSGWIGLGPKTAEFEQAFADYVGAPYCAAVNSCTAALHLAIKLLDLPPGAEVITTPITFVSTNHVILYENLKPVFADIEPYTGNIDVRSVASKTTPNTGAIIAVHYGGYPCALDDLYALGREHGIPIIEDCAHACGAEYRGKRIGGCGDIHAFSFHAVKNLPMGDGGALTVRSEEHFQRLKRLRWMGIDKDTFERSDESTRRAYSWEYDVCEVGYKYHINDISAAIGLAQLKYLDEDNAHRARIASHYRAELANVPGIQLLKYEDDRRSSYHLCCVLVDDRDALVDKLRDNGVGVGVHYKRNDHYPMYEEQDLPNTEWFTSRVMSLPLHLYLTDDDVDYVCRVIREGW